MDITNLFEFLKRVMPRSKEIQQLYNLSEAEMTLMVQMARAVDSVMDCSPELQVKLLKGLCAMKEMMLDEARAYAKEKGRDAPGKL